MSDEQERPKISFHEAVQQHVQFALDMLQSADFNSPGKTRAAIISLEAIGNLAKRHADGEELFADAATCRTTYNNAIGYCNSHFKPPSVQWQNCHNDASTALGKCLNPGLDNS